MVQKVATPVKWQELFGKAVREAVSVRQLGSGQWVATSATDPRKAYAVSLGACECPGHEYHGYCKHRALLAFQLGVLTLGGADPEPGAPAPAARRNPFGLSGAELVVLRGQAARRHAELGEPLVDDDGRVLDAGRYAA